MLFAPTCKLRGCFYFKGAVQPDGTEKTEIIICEAFPQGIPNEIAYGENLHLHPVAGQVGTFVFKKEKRREV